MTKITLSFTSATDAQDFFDYFTKVKAQGGRVEGQQAEILGSSVGDASTIEMIREKEPVSLSLPRTAKVYACKECGYEEEITTNHYGECYSWGGFNVCPNCPPFRRPTVWVCKETAP